MSLVSKTSQKDLEVSIPKTVLQAPYSAIPTNQRYFILFIVSLAGFLGPMSGNIYIPVLPQLETIFHTSTTTINGTVSVFMVVFAFAPLIWAPFADFGGRNTLYFISLPIFIVANVILAIIPPHISTLYIFRIFQAIGASSVISVGAGTIADIFEPKVRGQAISYFMMGPQLGPVLGPVFSLVAINHWRWMFGFTAVFGSAIYLLILFFLPETLRYLVGNGECIKGWVSWPRLLQKRLVEDSPKFPKPPKPSLRVWYSLFKFKPALLCSLTGALVFASFYGMAVTFGQVLQQNYGFKGYQTSLSYICPGVSLILGSTIAGRVSDILRRNMDIYIPEKRFSIQIIGLAISIIGVLGYGWSIDFHIHVSALFIFFFLGGFGMTWMFVLNTTYLTECSTGQPATMVAMGNMMRNLSAAIASSVIDILISKMGYGWCFTGLGLVNLFSIGLIAWNLKCGERWRAEWKST